MERRSFFLTGYIQKRRKQAVRAEVGFALLFILSDYWEKLSRPLFFKGPLGVVNYCFQLFHTPRLPGYTIQYAMYRRNLEDSYMYFAVADFPEQFLPY